MGPPRGAAPIPDRQTVTPDGERIDPLPEGVTLRDAVTHVDERGSVCEIFDPRWGWHPDPLVFVYTFTIRPGWAKGWGVHRRHEDRYFLLAGEMEVVFYDERDDSPTTGFLAKIVLSEHRRRLMNIPAGVWHTDRNLGDKGLRRRQSPDDRVRPRSARQAAPPSRHRRDPVRVRA
jgi:dTDP-4-dehydrorhamnose 3,5-epimerase